MQNTYLRVLQRNEDFFKYKLQAPFKSYAIELRKTNRKKHINKKRKVFYDTSNTDTINISQILLQFNNELIDSHNINTLKEWLRNIRNIVCKYNSKNVFTLIEPDHLAFIIDTLEKTFDLDIIKESTLILCNFANGSTEIIEVLIELKIIERLMQLVDCKWGEILESADIIENVIWCLGNIAGDSDCSCNLVANSEFLPKLWEIFEKVKEAYGIQQITAWTLANLSRKGSLISLKNARILLQIIKIISVSACKDVQFDCIRAISWISYRKECFIELIIETGLIPYTLSLISNESEEIHSSAIRASGNLLSGNTAQTQILINLGVIERFQEKISSNCLITRKEVFWALGNIAAGSISQIAHLVDHPIMIIAFSGLFDHDYYIRSETSWILRNISIKGSINSISILLDLGLLKYLMHGLQDFVIDIKRNCAVVGISILKALVIHENIREKDEIFEFLNILSDALYEVKGDFLDDYDELCNHIEYIGKNI